MTMFCVMNENRRGGFGGNVHIRQLKETEDGNRSPMLRDNRAIIEVVSDNYYIARATSGEVIGISDIFTNVLARINYAQPKATINVEYQGEMMTLERYKEINAPDLWRIQLSTSEKHGELIAVDRFSEGESSKVVIFKSLDEVMDEIVKFQADDNRYFIHSTSGIVKNELQQRRLGLETLDLTDNQSDNSHLKAFIAEVRREQDAESEVKAYEQ